MALNTTENRAIGFALRALQLIFAAVVIGTDAYAIHVFRGHTVYEQFEFGNFYDYYGVPDAWGFLLFCVAWTLLGVVFLVVAGVRFVDHVWIGYLRVAVEAVALLSWLAGFIAVAVNIGSSACPPEENHCGLLKAATVFGGLEFLLFAVTTSTTVQLVLGQTRWPKTSAPQTSTTSPDVPI
ncbi:MARVEL-like domain protein [Niveomyces insectorum RCEF 264]|uniref:MARVEL-like domain protein n=1 Tax=Niveomyces insectorum RCEF 264 TaxID=1081102 RepID=A0A167SE02_9HYPO|nr:MARVEL-like domain protein [Niveomyces insectorum RCEF 264]